LSSDVNVTTRRGLGRGLEVLIGGAGQPELLHLPVEAIHPNPRQPRRRFEPEATAGLAASIRLQGVLQPVVVRPRAEGGYQLVAGERRWRAAREAGVPTLPALVREADDRDSLLLGLVENVARENLSPVEEARAYASLIDEFELSLGDVAERVGRSKASVSNRVRLLDLPEEILWMLVRGELTEGHARAVLALPDDIARTRLAKRIAAEGMTVRAAERAAQDGGSRRRPRRRTAVANPALIERVRLAASQLTGLPARVVGDRLELQFGDETRLEELAETLERALSA
jgi:ParB family chromosome partitioning protein